MSCIAAVVEQWREAVGGPEPRIRSNPVPASLRAEAVAQLIAAEAGKNESVIEFRKRVLRGKVLSPDSIDRFIGAVAKVQDAKPWVKLYVSPEELEMGVVPIGTSNLVGNGYDILEYAVPCTDQVRRVLVSSRGILGWLYWLSAQLSEKFLWERRHATTFVLTGVVPPIRESEYHVQSSRAVPALTRVVMQLDPTMSPREVANPYRQIRFRYFGRRHRSMTPKHIELAKFWAANGEDVIWKDLMAEWNKRHPRWAYKREQNFSRDCFQARDRLLGQNPVRSTAGGNAG